MLVRICWLSLIVVLSSFPPNHASAQTNDSWQPADRGQVPAVPPAPAAQAAAAPSEKPASGASALPVPPEDLKAQIEEQRKTIQWLTETVKSLQSKTASLESATLPLLPSSSPSTEQSILPIAFPAEPDAGSVEQPGPSDNTSPVPNTTPGGPQRLGGGPPFVNMPDSLGFKSPNGQHEVHLTGQIQTDGRFYKNADDTTDIDQIFLRRARLGVEGVVFNNYEFRILPDFGNNKLFVLQDCLANIHYVDWFQVMGGKFKEPVSFEQAFVQDRFVPTIERSIIDQITPQRDIGFMIYGRGLLGDQIDWYAGVFNGEINSDVDTNKTKDYAGRIVWRPLNYDFVPDCLRPIQIGVSGTVGAEHEPLNLAGAALTNPSTEMLRTSSQVPWLTFISTAKADGTRDRVVPELSYFYGPVGLCTQFIRMDQEISPGTGANIPHDVRFEGYMLTATYMLTGEYHKAWGFFQPFNSFDPSHPFTNPGAWEAVAALSRLHVDSAIFHAGANELANPVGQSDGATQLTFGFNWYLNGYVKVQFDWEHAIFDQPVLLNTASNLTFRVSNTLMTRLQLAF